MGFFIRCGDRARDAFASIVEDVMSASDKAQRAARAAEHANDQLRKDNERLRREADDLRGQVVTLRRELAKRPEAGWEEKLAYQTQLRIAAERAAAAQQSDAEVGRMFKRLGYRYDMTHRKVVQVPADETSGPVAPTGFYPRF